MLSMLKLLKYLIQHLDIWTIFEGIVNRIYPPALQLNKTNTPDTKAPFLHLHLSISMDLFHLKFMISEMTLILI